MNARFKIMISSESGSPRVTTLTLKPGEKVRHHQCHRTDEGYRREVNTWCYLGHANGTHRGCYGLIVWSVYVEERDCDGLYEYAYLNSCHLMDLRAHAYEALDGEVQGGWPKWVSEKVHTRDHTAERAGY